MFTQQLVIQQRMNQEKRQCYEKEAQVARLPGRTRAFKYLDLIIGLQKLIKRVFQKQSNPQKHAA